MWCTRWFLPLFLLPLPTAPPFFLVLLLFSLTIHAKPCFYCIVLLATLFISTCYWQPLPLDTSLSRPWSDSITTYAEAINETLRASGYWDMKYAQHQSVPEVIHPVDRCWCDFASGTFFEPFNTTEWEVLSVNRVKEGMMRRAKYAEDLEKKKEVKEEGMELEEPTDMPRTVSPYTPSPSASTWGRATNATSISIGGIRSSLWKAFESWKFAPRNAQSDEQVRTVSQNTSNHACQSLLRKEYDLRPYGVGIVVDFSWSRNT